MHGRPGFRRLHDAVCLFRTRGDCYGHLMNGALGIVVAHPALHAEVLAKFNG